MRVLALVDFGQHRTQLGQRHRRAEQVALNEIAAVTFEKIVLLEGFDAFGDDLQMQGMGHDNNGLDDFQVLGGLGDVLNELAVGRANGHGWISALQIMTDSTGGPD
jgi:hypothetical protein